jgi:hypothetical protein
MRRAFVREREQCRHWLYRRGGIAPSRFARAAAETRTRSGQSLIAPARLNINFSFIFWHGVMVMKRATLFAALLATSAIAEAKSISEIYFYGRGFVTAAAGHPHGPNVGQWNRIDGHIKVWQPDCLAADVDGTIALGSPGKNWLCESQWSAIDRFQLADISAFGSQFPFAELTFDHGKLIGVNFSGLNGPSFLRFDTTTFFGQWFDYTPWDYSYSGTWTLEKVLIGYDGETLVPPPPEPVPEPASWAMLITGFGMIGAGLRRRRRMAGAV